MEPRMNVLVVGTTGAGKSTLIRAITHNEDIEVGSGDPVTEKPFPYPCNELNLELIDSRGFQYDVNSTRKSVKDLRSYIRKGFDNQDKQVHMIWFCLDASSDRIEGVTWKYLGEIKKAWKDVPVIIVLTKSFSQTADERHIKDVKRSWKKYTDAADDTMCPDIIPVLAVEDEDRKYEARGIEELIEATNSQRIKADKLASAAMFDFNVNKKRGQVGKTVLLATGLALGKNYFLYSNLSEGALVLIETIMLEEIGNIYKVDDEGELVDRIRDECLRSGALTMTEMIILEQLKTVPGLNLAAINCKAGADGVMVLSTGIIAWFIMERLYKKEWTFDNVTEFFSTNKERKDRFQVIYDTLKHERNDNNYATQNVIPNPFTA